MQCLEPIPLILESPELGGSINDAILSTGFVSLALPGGRGTAREHGTSSGASGDNREHTASSWQLSPPGVPNEHGLTPVVVSEASCASLYARMSCVRHLFADSGSVSSRMLRWFLPTESGCSWAAARQTTCLACRTGSGSAASHSSCRWGHGSSLLLPW